MEHFLKRFIDDHLPASAGVLQQSSLELPGCLLPSSTTAQGTWRPISNVYFSCHSSYYCLWAWYTSGCLCVVLCTTITISVLSRNWRW